MSELLQTYLIGIYTTYGQLEKPPGAKAGLITINVSNTILTWWGDPIY
jgi:hypothetical protein